MKKNIFFSASILSSDFTQMQSNIDLIQSCHADFIHFDVMDGNFVPVITFGHQMVADCRKRTDLPFDVHLMVDKPERFISDFVKAGATYLTIQAEATIHLHRVLTLIKESGCRAGLAVVPSTSVESIVPILPILDLVLVMTVNPGYGGQKFIPETLEKVKQLAILRQSKQYSYLIEVDGGINLVTHQAAKDAGVDILVAGSAFIQATDPALFVRIMKDSAHC